MKTSTPVYSGLTALGLALSLGIQSALGLVTVTVQPTNQVVFVGNTAVFNAQVNVTAGETITGYTWLMSTNGENPFITIPGATTSTYTLPNVQLTNDGYYFVKVTFNSGTSSGLVSVSPEVRLIVPDQARITVQPQGLVRLPGTSASFSVAALGTLPLGYRWRFNQVNLANNGRITGATSPNLTISGLLTADSGSYDVVVTNSYSSVTSDVATLGVYVPPGISVQPSNTTVILGNSAALSVTTTGSEPLSFQWFKNGNSLSNNGRISGATSNVLTIAAAIAGDAGSYKVSVTNPVGAVTSSVVSLTVLVPATFTSPTNAIGRQGAFFNFTNTAAGTTPITFGADGLPAGLSLDSQSGVISGIPDVMGVFPVALYATNVAMTTTGQLVITLTTGVPGITSPLAVNGKQGVDFTYTITASNNPVSFSAAPLPSGLVFDPLTGVISGAPLANGTFPISIGASNQYGVGTNLLTMTVSSSVPVITSTLSAYGKQGQNFFYTATATEAAVFSARGLPSGLHIDPASGLIAGPPVVSGVFQPTLTAANQFGSDNRTLTLVITSSVPVITSPLSASWTQNQGSFSYAIRASDSPTLYGASNLPLGLAVDPNTGIISGTPWYGGTFTAQIWANNAWGTGTTNLVFNITYATLNGLAITDVTHTWSKPYLLDFTFSIRDGTDATNRPVVRPASDFQVVCMEDGVPISSEAPLIFQNVVGSGAKQLKTFLVLDYTYSMYVVPGAIDAMEAAADLLINEEPAHAQFGIIEFNADYMAPQFVTNKLTSPNKYFISDKTVLAQSIAGIRDTYVQGNYAGTRCWDAIYAALNQFGTTNTDEQRYLVAMTDGNDASSVLNTQFYPKSAIEVLIETAQAKQVAIYCVGFGNNINTNSLEQLTSQTGGHYYVATSASELASQFQSIQEDVSSFYTLRWATLQRAAVPAFPVPGFQPSFIITYGNFADSWNTNIVITNVTIVDDSQDPPVTNSFTTNAVVFPFNPPDWTNDVRRGSLRLVPDANVGVQTIRLRATYTPRYVRAIQFNYRPNYPCTANLDSAGTNGILYGWSLNETADSNGLRTLTLTSSDTNNLLTSIPYAAFGDLLSFNFAYPDALTTTQAFSVFSVDNSIYTNVTPAGISFTNENFPSFVTVYPPPPPYGTPVPWLISYGFTNNFAAAEVSDPNHNGLLVWQEYLAGLNPTNVASRFDVSMSFQPGVAPQVLFSTVEARTYRVETSTDLLNWDILRDGITGTGGYILFIDNRVLSGADAIFYRVAVY